MRAVCEGEVTRARQKRKQFMADEHIRKRLKLPLQSEPEHPGTLYGPDVSAIDVGNLWQAGSRDYPVSDAVLRGHVGDCNALGVFVKNLRKNRKLHKVHNVFVKDNAHGFKQRQISSWRARTRCCKYRHRGLCAHDAGDLYAASLEVAKQMHARLKIIDSNSPAKTVFEKVGEAIFRVSCVDSAEAHFIRWFLLSCYCGNPKRCAFVELQRQESDGEHVLFIPLSPDGMLEHITGHALSLQLLREHKGAWCMAEFAF